MILAADNQLDSELIARYQRCIFIGNSVMIVTSLLLFTALMASFGFGEYLSIKIQIMAHLMTIFSAAGFKVGYVVRCVGAFNLGHKAF